MAKVGKEREGCSEWHHLKEELGKVEGEGGQDALDQYWSVARQVRQTTRQIETDDDDLKIGYRTP